MSPAPNPPKPAAFPADPFLATIIGEVGRLGAFTVSNQRLAEIFDADGPGAPDWADAKGMTVSAQGEDWTTFKKKAAPKK